MMMRCRSCGDYRSEEMLDCVMVRRDVTVTSYYRYCKDKPECREKALETERNNGI